MTDDTNEYELRDSIQRVTAADVSLEQGETVELTEKDAQKINDRRDEPILQPVDGSDDVDEEEDDGGDA